MSRSTDLLFRIKKGLEDLHQKSISTPEIFYSIFRAQQDIGTRFDLIKKQVVVTTIEDQETYDLVALTGSAITAGSFVTGTQYQIQTVGTTDFTLIGAASNNVGVVFTATGAGSGTGTVKAAHTGVKKIYSMRTPQDWVKLYWKTDDQMDQIREEQSVSRPQYVIFRNDKLEFYAAPNETGDEIILQTYFHTPIQEPTDSIEPETPKAMDPALEAYAIYDLLPIDHPQKVAMLDLYEKIANDRYGKLHNNTSKPIVPTAKW